MELKRLTPEEITDLARGVVTNRIFVAWDPLAMESAFGGFLMLALGSAEEHGEDISWLDDLGLCWEYIDKAGSMGMNGYPMFLSAHFTHKDDRFLIQRECLRLAVGLGTVTQAELNKFDADFAEFERQEKERAEQEVDDDGSDSTTSGVRRSNGDGSR